MISADGRVAGRGYREVPQYFPAAGHVEHDALEILECVKASAPATPSTRQVGPAGCNRHHEPARDRRHLGARHGTPGASGNQGDRRRRRACREFVPRAEWLARHTGLVPDPYFSATKIEWLLEHEQLLTRYHLGDLAVGTIDAVDRLSRLTGGKVHATDPTNASRTMPFDIDTRSWSDELCSLFGVPMDMLPAGAAVVGRLRYDDARRARRRSADSRCRRRPAGRRSSGRAAPTERGSSKNTWPNGRVPAAQRRRRTPGVGFAADC